MQLAVICISIIVTLPCSTMGYHWYVNVCCLTLQLVYCNAKRAQGTLTLEGKTSIQSSDLESFHFQNLCSCQWLPAVAEHLKVCLEDHLRRVHVPAFFTTLFACVASSEPGVLEDTLLKALRALAQQVSTHLSVIDAVVEAARKHVDSEALLTSMERIVSVRGAYLNSVATMLRPTSTESLQQACSLLAASTCLSYNPTTLEPVYCAMDRANAASHEVHTTERTKPPEMQSKSNDPATQDAHRKQRHHAPMPLKARSSRTPQVSSAPTPDFGRAMKSLPAARAYHPATKCKI
jgi:hypothetical protein